MNAIRLMNFRSLTDTSRIDLKPLTILVGANSSGKSSLLRVFPLLKQSVETPTAGPLLWFGRYVDFGSLADVIHSSASERTVRLAFSFELTPDGRAHEPWAPAILVPLEPTNVDIEIVIESSADGQGSRVRACNVTYGELKATVGFDAGGFVSALTSGALDLQLPGQRLRARDAYLIPSFALTRTDRPPKATTFQRYAEHSAIYIEHTRFATASSSLLQPVLNELESYFHGLIKTSTRFSTARNIRLGPSALVREHLKTLRGGEYWRNNIGTIPGWRLQRVLQAVLANGLPALLEYADREVASFAAGVQYLGPVRATAERYYRTQELAVREIDFRGENLAMFVRSLSEFERISFSEFARTYFGFEVLPRVGMGHVEIRIKEVASGQEINLADVGFGYSQMLPLMAQLWAVRSQRRSSSSLIAIEQPELHLHPSHQSRLADMFVGVLGASRTDKRRTRLFVETHSEAIINRVGELIRTEQLDSADVQILVFSRNESSNESALSFARYDKDGALQDWPFGFFAPVGA